MNELIAKNESLEQVFYLFLTYIEQENNQLNDRINELIKINESLQQVFYQFISYIFRIIINQMI